MPNTTKARLIQIMASSLLSKGYLGTGINQVLKESGATSGSLYHFFPGGKEELAAAAIDYVTDEFLRGLDRYSAGSDDLRAVFRRVLQAFKQEIESSGFQKGWTITSTTLEVSDQLPLLHEAVSRCYQRVQGHIEHLLLRNGWSGKGAGKMSCLLISLIEGAFVICKAYQDTQPLEFAMDAVDGLLEQRF